MRYFKAALAICVLCAPIAAESQDVETAAVSPGYEIDPQGDPLTEEVTKLLKDQGLLARQEEMGRALVLLDRHAQFYTAVAGLMDVIGPDAKIEVAPGQYMTFMNTTLGKRAIVAELQQKSDLITAEMALERQKHEQRVTQPAWAEAIDKQATLRLPDRVSRLGANMVSGAVDRAEKKIQRALGDLERLSQRETEEINAMMEEAKATARDIVSSTQEAIEKREREQMLRIAELEAEIAVKSE